MNTHGRYCLCGAQWGHDTVASAARHPLRPRCRWVSHAVFARAHYCKCARCQTARQQRALAEGAARLARARGTS